MLVDGLREFRCWHSWRKIQMDSSVILVKPPFQER